MSTYLITWNPNRFNWKNYRGYAKTIAENGQSRKPLTWSCGVNKSIKQGDRFYFLKLGTQPKGIIGSGTFASDVFQDGHWDGSGRDANFIKLRFDKLVDCFEDDTDFIPQDELAELFPTQEWSPQGSGIRIKDEIVEELDLIWRGAEQQQKAYDLFEAGKEYKRTDLHKKYGGSGWGGIAASANHPIIFIFTTHNGEQYGYADGWDEENYFHYTGEGQLGDMTFTMGNKALLEHEKRGKRVFLFELSRKGYYKYSGELRLVDYIYFTSPDREGNLRQAIKFKLQLAGTKELKPGQGSPGGRNYNKPERTERKGLITSRVGQGYYRNCLLDRWERKCAVTGLGITQILIASHIVPWREATDEERLDVDNGILLSPNLDALFDRHFISFADDGKIVLAPAIPKEYFATLGVHDEMQIVGLTKGNLKYLKRHREKLQ